MCKDVGDFVFVVLDWILRWCCICCQYDHNDDDDDGFFDDDSDDDDNMLDVEAWELWWLSIFWWFSIL